MALWNSVKKASVEARRKDEECHARAMYEIQSGKRRDGLWAKSVLLANGDEAATKLAYFKLLVQAIQDDDLIFTQSPDIQKNNDKELSLKPHSALRSAKKPRYFKYIISILILAPLIFTIITLKNIDVKLKASECAQPNPSLSVITQEALYAARTQEEVASAMSKLDWDAIIHARSTGECNQGVGEFVWDMQNLSPGQIQQRYGHDVASEFMRRLVISNEKQMAKALSR